MAMWVRGNVTDLTPSRLSTMRTTVGTQTIINGTCQDIDKHNAIYRIVMQTTKTGTDKCKAGLYATLII